MPGGWPLGRTSRAGAETCHKRADVASWRRFLRVLVWMDHNQVVPSRYRLGLSCSHHRQLAPVSHCELALVAIAFMPCLFLRSSGGGVLLFSLMRKNSLMWVPRERSTDAPFGLARVPNHVWRKPRPKICNVRVGDSKMFGLELSLSGRASSALA